MAKGGLRDQARGWSTKPAAQARTELGLAAQGGRRDLWRQACPSPHSSPPHRRQRARGPQMPPSQSHTHTQRHRQEHGTHGQEDAKLWKTGGADTCSEMQSARLVTRLTHLRSQPHTSYRQLQTCHTHPSITEAPTHMGTMTRHTLKPRRAGSLTLAPAPTSWIPKILLQGQRGKAWCQEPPPSPSSTGTGNAPHPPRSQAQPSPPLPQAATAGANTFQRGSLSALQLPSLCHLPSEAPKGDAALPAKHGCSRKAPGPSDVPGAVGKRATAQPGRWGHRRRAGHAVRHLPHRLPPNPSTSCG